MYIYMYCRCYIYIYIYINIPPLACPGTFCVIMCNRYYVHITWIHAAVVKTINYTCSVYIYIYLCNTYIYVFIYLHTVYKHACSIELISWWAPTAIPTTETSGAKQMLDVRVHEDRRLRLEPLVNNPTKLMLVMVIWLVAWNMAFIFPYIGKIKPNWLPYFSEG